MSTDPSAGQPRFHGRYSNRVRSDAGLSLGGPDGSSAPLHDLKRTQTKESGPSGDHTNYGRSTAYKPGPRAVAALQTLLEIPTDAGSTIQVSRWEYGSGDGQELDESLDTTTVQVDGKVALKLEGRDAVQRLVNRMSHAGKNPADKAAQIVETDPWYAEYHLRFANVATDDGLTILAMIDEAEDGVLRYTVEGRARETPFSSGGVIIVDVDREAALAEHPGLSAGETPF